MTADSDASSSRTRTGTLQTPDGSAVSRDGAGTGVDGGPSRPAADDRRPETRIQARNRARIIAAALDVFATHGFGGSTVDAIAANAGMSKANVLYYFGRKRDIYDAVLERTLTVWLDPLEQLDPAGDPVEELLRYARAKLQLSRDAPDASRLFASEMLQGAPRLEHYLHHELGETVGRACDLLQGWIDAGRLAPVEPLNLLFLIWATTQHYADFAPQVSALRADADRVHADAWRTLELILRKGLAPA